MTEVWFIRHGESESNAGLATTGTAQVKLTELGHEQARKVCAAFSKAPDLIVTSSYTRAMQTAQYTMERFPQVPVKTWETHEFSYLSRLGTSTIAERRPRARAYWERNDPTYIDGIDAESFEHFIGRIRTMQARIRQQSGFVAIFGHGFLMKATIWAHIIGSYHANADYMQRYYAFNRTFEVRNGAIIKAEYLADRTLLSGLMTEHLGERS